MGKGEYIDGLAACGGDCCVDAGDCAFRETFYVIWGIRMGVWGRAPCADTRPASANNPRSSWDFMLVERVGRRDTGKIK